MIQGLKISTYCLAGLMIAAITLAVGHAASGVAAPAPVPCGKVATVTGVQYCYHARGKNPQYTIWFFHGAGDSEQALEHSFLGLSKETYNNFQGGLPSVNIVLISYDPFWLLTNYPDRKKYPANATVAIFKSKIVPFIESKYKPAKPYVVMGHSMGGFNAATLCAAQPAMWSKCVLVNPLLPSSDPFPFNQLLDNFHIDQQPNLLQNCNDFVHLAACFGANKLIVDNFSGKGWHSTQPMVLLKETASLPKTFVTACKGDEWGDGVVEFNGSEQWANLAKSKNANSAWEPVMTPCDHFHWPVQPVLDFLADRPVAP